MVSLKTPKEIERMRTAGVLASTARKIAGQMIAPGVSTKAIEREIRSYLKARNAKPSFLGYNGFPAAVCISVNEEVIHGIPGVRKLVKGDIVSVDVGVCIDGYHGDCAATFICGDTSDEHKRLIEVTRNSFFRAFEVCRKGSRVGDISNAVQTYVEESGFNIVRDYVGHGVGRLLHEDPEIPNYRDPKRHGTRLMNGMTIAVEPMVNLGGMGTRVLRDKWTVVTSDGKASAHYENTILVTSGEPEILTPLEGDGFVK